MRDSITARSDEAGVDGNDLRLRVAAALLLHDHPERNALTRPKEPLEMLREHPTFFACDKALSRADAVLSAIRGADTDLITARSGGTSDTKAGLERDRAEIAEAEEHRAKNDLRSARAELRATRTALDVTRETLAHMRHVVEQDNCPDDVSSSMSTIDDDSRRVFDYVRVTAEKGRSADRIVESTARVFTTDWPLRRRLRLAWTLIRG